MRTTDKYRAELLLKSPRLYGVKDLETRQWVKTTGSEVWNTSDRSHAENRAAAHCILEKGLTEAHRGILLRLVELTRDDPDMYVTAGFKDTYIDLDNTFKNINSVFPYATLAAMERLGLLTLRRVVSDMIGRTEHFTQAHITPVGREVIAIDQSIIDL